MYADTMPTHGTAGYGFTEKLNSIITIAKKHEIGIVIFSLLFIIAINVFLRSGLLVHQGLFEPDGFYYYSVIRETINNGLVVPTTPILSGFPWHNARGENVGLPLLTVIVYQLVKDFGISYLTVMRLLPILFGVLYALCAYWLAKELTGNRYTGLLAAGLLSISSGNIARTAALVYRGDSFSSLVLLLALILTAKMFKSKGIKDIALYAIASGVVLSTGIIVWSGAPFEVMIYIFAMLLFTIYGFIYGSRDVLSKNAILLGGLLIAYVLEHVYELFGMVKPGFYLGSTDFFIFYLPIAVACILAFYLVDNPTWSFFAGRKNRLIVVFLCIALVSVILFGTFGRHIDRLLAFNGVVATGNQTYDQIGRALAGTTQEQQAVSWGFLFASFNLQLPLAFVGVLLLPAFLAREKRDHGFSSPKIIFTNEFMILFAYFAITLFLQVNAIRFNALLSIPLAIFAACGAYLIYETSKRIFIERNTRQGLAVSALMGIIALYLLDKFAYFFVPTLLNAGSNMLLLTGIALTTVFIAASIICITFGIVSINKRKTRLVTISFLLILALLAYNFYNTYITAYSATQADGINSNFLNAMTWLRSNTPKNATVLALWPDGSVVEGWANRTSYMDSVGGENRTRIYFFSKFLFNTSSDSSYLYQIGKPDYLVTRGFWYNELGGIAAEGLIPNTSSFGYSVLSGLDISHSNNTSTYLFKSNQPPYYNAKLVVQQNNEGSAAFEAFIGTSTGVTMIPMKRVLFYNEQNKSYSIAESNASNATDLSLMISYMQNRIVGGAILGPKLVDTNLFKLTILCNVYVCPYDNGNVSMNMVYANNDTRIYKIEYR